jgi:hypothetical protein
MGLDYTPGEVAYLLGMTHREALEEDGPRAATFGADGGGDAGEQRVPTYARWCEVRAAQRRVRGRKLDAAAAERAALEAQLRAQGYSESEVAELADASSSSVGRRFKATLTEILDELGVVDDDAGETPALSRIALCLLCGQRPRARAAAVRRRVRGGWRTVVAERELGVCARCALPEVSLVGGPGVSAREQSGGAAAVGSGV